MNDLENQNTYIAKATDVRLYLIQNLQYENHRAIKLSPQKEKKKGGGYFYPNWKSQICWDYGSEGGR